MRGDWQNDVGLFRQLHALERKRKESARRVPPAPSGAEGREGGGGEGGGREADVGSSGPVDERDKLDHVCRLQYGDGVRAHCMCVCLSSTAKAPVASTASKPSATVQAETVASSSATNTQSKGKRKAVASPAVRRLAREMNIDICDVKGSGTKGRVYKEDLHAHKQGGQQPTRAVTVNAPVEVATATTRVEPIKGVKAAMARAMQESVSTIPHFTYSDEIDLTALVALRKKLKPEYEKQGIKLTMMPFFMKAMSMAIKQFPIMNSQPNAECTELTYFDDHNIGMAVDSKVGLLVPNIKSCQTKSIKQIAQDVMEMTDKAREGRLSPDQLKGGTISISNIGALGGTTATPIINKPEVAIVALGKMQTLPRFNAEGNVEARQIMNVSWSGDHRIIDGGTIARFNSLWTKYLEDPTSMIMDMV